MVHKLNLQDELENLIEKKSHKIQLGLHLLVTNWFKIEAKTLYQLLHGFEVIYL
jgi:hypothetical protein